MELLRELVKEGACRLVKALQVGTVEQLWAWETGLFEVKKLLEWELLALSLSKGWVKERM